MEAVLVFKVNFELSNLGFLSPLRGPVKKLSTGSASPYQHRLTLLLTPIGIFQAFGWKEIMYGTAMIIS